MRASFLQGMLILAVLLGFAGAGLGGPPGRAGWTLTFDDEFDGTSLDPEKMEPKKDPSGWERNQELQAYARRGRLSTRADLEHQGGKARSLIRREVAFNHLRHDDHPRKVQPAIRAL